MVRGQHRQQTVVHQTQRCRMLRMQPQARTGCAECRREAWLGRLGPLSPVGARASPRAGLPRAQVMAASLQAVVGPVSLWQASRGPDAKLLQHHSLLVVLPLLLAVAAPPSLLLLPLPVLLPLVVVVVVFALRVAPLLQQAAGLLLVMMQHFLLLQAVPAPPSSACCSSSPVQQHTAVV